MAALSKGGVPHDRGKSLISRGIGDQVRCPPDLAGSGRSTPAIAEQLAGGTIDQVQARTGRARHGDVRAIGRLVAKPMLHIHAGLGALEDNLTVHAPRICAKARPPKLRMIT
ncbi:hypothetical protein [Bradyrhizobium cajani]|uniref:Uncharacterized protein n=1 Tax=Bradyrhizobium cajani TaxID=1928661 RepID=A0A844TBP4_9BRAD|nr:hypothetical protein [Bradyrhizobium cajani]MCP3373781.1 hypothetical protein [Bradyrhizobium cajani]MVT76507.1 hypothetical protein [Bradyrhizobium cajani]